MDIIVERALLNAMRTCAELTSIVPPEKITNEESIDFDTLPYLKLYSLGGYSRAEQGYNVKTVKRRERDANWQVSILASSKESAATIINILNKLFTPGIPSVGLSCVSLVNDPDGYDAGSGRWHFPCRWRGKYVVQDAP